MNRLIDSVGGAVPLRLAQKAPAVKFMVIMRIGI